jgi:hypothetical protein
MNFALDKDILDLLGCKQVVDVRSQLPVNPNYTWAELAGVRPVSNLTTVVYHHDAIPKSRTASQSDIQLMSNIARHHISLKVSEPKGDAGFPYHIYIRNGTAYYCNTLVDRTYGVANNNGYTIHVSVSGDYTQDSLSQEDRVLLQAVSLQLARVLPSYKQIKAHSELNPTACPAHDYANIRAEVETLQHRLIQVNSWDSQIKELDVVRNQAEYMVNLMKLGEQSGEAQWAKNWLQQVYDIMKSKGLL